MTDFTVAGVTYRAGKLDAFAQFHVVRRLAPVMGVLPKMTGGASFTDMIGPLAEVIAKMPEEDCNYVLQKCLGITQRQIPGGGWSSVWNTSANMLQFQDIDLPAMMQITAKALQANLGPFLAALPSASSSGAPVSTAIG